LDDFLNGNPPQQIQQLHQTIDHISGLVKVAEDECQSWTQQQFLRQPFSMPGKRALRLDHRDAKPSKTFHICKLSRHIPKPGGLKPF